jgi:predicted Zn-dependent peptidase
MIQTFFRGTDIKYFAIIDNNPSPPSNIEKMKLLNQILESAKLKDKELYLERNIVKEDKGKTENSP